MENKDWTGNSRSAHAILGARNYAQNERETNDYYATEPKAARLLMEVEKFAPMIWECACGEGHLAKEFVKAGYQVYATDLIDRGYGYQQDFLSVAAPPLQGLRYNHKPSVFKSAGICGTRPRYIGGRMQGCNVPENSILRGQVPERAFPKVSSENDIRQFRAA